MHILFVHQNFPAQFGHIASHLVQKHGYRCTFVSEKPAMMAGGVECIQYSLQGGARDSTHFCSRTFENQIWHSAAVFHALRARSDIQPDLIVGHSGFLTTTFLRELYDAPQISYFEYFYRVHHSDMDFRKDLPPVDIPSQIRARIRNAGLLLDLDNCNAGYSPTRWQRDRLPAEYHSKVKVLFDGIDTDLWKPSEQRVREVAGVSIPADIKLITYVSRGLESMRGFDIFMQVAKRLCEQRSDLIFLVIGEDRIAYGGDSRFTDGKTFKQWVLEQDDYDLKRIHFTGRIPPTQLASVLASSDLHIYLTVPFVLSWSLFDALACGAPVLASGTGPVCEVITDGVTGWLAEFFDVDEWVSKADDILNNEEHRRLVQSRATELIKTQYSMETCLPRLQEFYSNTAKPRS